ncbi:MAG: hypothetical protein K0S00_4089 [Xanthobacteraceae bacterium]|jgi:hypothetical protein|nr:hypothetical protein [Xanthobacteraceae bacterium]
MAAAASEQAKGVALMKAARRARITAFVDASMIEPTDPGSATLSILTMGLAEYLGGLALHAPDREAFLKGCLASVENAVRDTANAMAANAMKTEGTA